MTEHLRNAKDVKLARKKLLEKQDGKCKVTGLELSEKDAVLDHDHETQIVRGVIHRQINAMLGKIEGANKRMIRWWLPVYLPSLLRWYADYLDECEANPQSIYHPGWIKKAKTEFNKLNSKAQLELLELFAVSCKGSNLVKRKELWSKLLNSKAVTYDEIKEELDYVNLKIKRGNYD